MKISHDSFMTLLDKPSPALGGSTSSSASTGNNQIPEGIPKATASSNTSTVTATATATVAASNTSNPTQRRKVIMVMDRLMAIIDKWLESQSFNKFGEKEDAIIHTHKNPRHSPLWDPMTVQMRDRYEYLLEKFPHQPWLSNLKELAMADQWLDSRSLNMFGDPKTGTYYPAGFTPLWDGLHGMRDRYEYLVEKFPHQPWFTRQ